MTGHPHFHSPRGSEERANGDGDLTRGRIHVVAGEELIPVLLPDGPLDPDPEETAEAAIEVERTNAVPTAVPEGDDRPVNDPGEETHVEGIV